MERFRLVAEGPRGGLSVAILAENQLPAGGIPYKLFEVVKGALLEIPGPPGAQVVVAIGIQTHTGRRFSYRAEEQVLPEGVARVRVPYATRSVAGTGATGPYQISVAGTRGTLHVPEAAVLRGLRVAVRPGRKGSREAASSMPTRPGDPH